MIDQSHINLLNLVATPLRKVSGSNGGEYKGACPVCGGTDRFIVQPETPNGGRWTCRNCVSSSGTLQWRDPIGYVMFAHGADFKTACLQLGVNPDSNQPAKREKLATKERYQPRDVALQVSHPADHYPADDDAWQTEASHFVINCVACLHENAGKSAREYLYRRGIRRNIMEWYLLGLNDRYREMQWGSVTVKLPRGIIIPWLGEDGTIYKVKVRRSDYDLKPGDAKYLQAAGGRSHELFNGSLIRRDSNVVLVETELDALLLSSCGIAHYNNAVFVATGSANDARTLSNASLLADTAHVFTAFDADEAGYKAHLWWQSALGSKHVTRLRPTEKDPGDMYAIRGRVMLKQWIATALIPALEVVNA